MEYANSSGDSKDDSPSQEETGYVHPTKLDLESVDDFEHITKDASPSKETTAQFLEHETKYAFHRNVDKPSYDSVEKGESVHGAFNEEQITEDLSSLNPETWDAGSPSVMDHSHNSPDLKFPLPSAGDIDSAFEDDIALSKNFMQYEKLHSGNRTDLTPQVYGDGAPDDSKLIDIETAPEFDPIPVTPGDLKSTNNSDISVLNRPTESKNLPATIASQSLPEIVKPENEADVLSENVPQGDGLHLGHSAGLDASDSEETVPEPLPKDYPEIGVIKPKDFFSTLGIDNWFHPERLNPKVESLIYWRDVKKSGVVFGGGLIALLSLCYYSLISVAAYSSLIVLTAAISFRIYKNVLQAVQKTSDGHPFKITLLKILNHKLVTEVFNTVKDLLELDLAMNPEKTRDILETFVKHLNNGIIELRRLFLVEDIIDSIKFGVLLWAMTYLGSWFNGLSLIIMGYVALFTLPKVYENNKAQIDANLDLAKGKINEVVDKVKAVIPLGKKDEAKSKNE